MNIPDPTRTSFAVRPNAAAAPASGIVEIANYARSREGVLPFWVGEGDRPTPDFIAEAARRSLAAGETFYTYQDGVPSLRETIAQYLSRVYDAKVGKERIFVTSSGMHALQIAITLTAGPGDEVIVPTPAWPNFVGALTVSGAAPCEVPMRFGNRGWQLDVDDIARAVTPKSRALVVNSPANPTGWTAIQDELRALLDIARRNGLWVIADEIYGRFYYDGPRAPSFKDVMRDDDRVLFVQTLSKNWAMTGWRIGWLEAPPGLAATVTNLVQYSSSGTPVFIQRAAEAAISEGEPLIAEQVSRARANRDILIDAFARAPKFRVAPPPGALYLFFGVEGFSDTRALAFKLIDEARVGLAPGNAFSKAGEGYLRLCYLRRTEDIVEAAGRLTEAVSRA